MASMLQEGQVASGITFPQACLPSLAFSTYLDVLVVGTVG